MLEQVSFVRLIPRDLVRRYRTQIQSADAVASHQTIDERPVLRQRRDDERRTDRFRDFRHRVRRNIDDGHEREEELPIRQWMRHRLTMNDGRQQVGPAILTDEPWPRAMSRGDVLSAGF